MYKVRVIENHGHNGDDEYIDEFKTYGDAWNHILNFYFDGNETLMTDSTIDYDVWECEEADAEIHLE